MPSKLLFYPKVIATFVVIGIVNIIKGYYRMIVKTYFINPDEYGGYSAIIWFPIIFIAVLAYNHFTLGFNCPNVLIYLFASLLISAVISAVVGLLSLAFLWIFTDYIIPFAKVNWGKQ